MERLKKNYFTIPQGTIFYHQRFKRFANGGNYPYAPANWLSINVPYFAQKIEGCGLNTYQYVAKKDIPNLLLMDYYLQPDDLEELISTLDPSVDICDMHCKVEFLKNRYECNGVVNDYKKWSTEAFNEYTAKWPTPTCESNEYRLPASVVKEYLTFVSVDIQDDEIAKKEIHTKYVY